MPSYAVSFELASNSTYGERYRSLMEQLRATPNGFMWPETTSFVLIESTETLSEIADRLYYRTQVSAATDILLVFDPAASTAIARGPIKYPALLRGKFRYFTQK